MSVGGLIGETWTLVRRNALRMLVTAGVLLLPAELATGYAAEDSTTAGLIAYGAVSLIAYPWAIGALVAILHAPSLRPVDAYRDTTPRLPSLFLANLAGGIAVLLALLLLVLPGLLLAARWSATAGLVVIERKPAYEAFAASNELVKGRTWTVLGALVVTLIASAVAALPAATVSAFVSAPWAVGLADFAIDVPLTAGLAAFAYTVYSQLPRDGGAE